MPVGLARHSLRSGSHLRDVVGSQESDLVATHAVTLVEVLFRVLEGAEYRCKIVRRWPIQCPKRSEDVIDVDLFRLHLLLEPCGHYEVLVVQRRGVLRGYKILQRHRSSGQIETAQERRSLRHLLPPSLRSAVAVGVGRGVILNILFLDHYRAHFRLLSLCREWERVSMTPESNSWISGTILFRAQPANR